MSSWKVAVVALVGGLLFGAQAFAQAGGGGGRPDPAQFRQRMMDRFKEQLAPSDDEWKVIQPKLEKVMNAQRDSRGGFFGGGRRGGGNGGGNTTTPETPVAKAMADLRTTLENKDAKADEILGKLKALREAREKGRAELAAAQKELKEVLTQRQEAQLVLNGMLE